jgi:hypothetical protein
VSAEGTGISVSRAVVESAARADGGDDGDRGQDDEEVLDDVNGDDLAFDDGEVNERPSPVLYSTPGGQKSAQRDEVNDDDVDDLEVSFDSMLKRL